MALNIKTLGIRALTALVFVLVLLGSLLWNYYSFTLFFFAVAIWGLFEFYQLVEKLGARPYKITGFIAAVLLYLSSVNISFLRLSGSHEVLLFYVLIIIPFVILASAVGDKTEKPLYNAFYSIIGVLYCVLPFALLHKLVIFTGPAGNNVMFDPYFLFGIILLIWSNDTFAYLGGSLFGKHKMIARISPGKTWEGTVFGILMTGVSGYIVGTYIVSTPHIGLWIILGLVVPVLATLGDLLESMIKRQAGVKDTGSIMPGHGGILDRFDSLIFVSPFVFVIAKLIA